MKQFRASMFGALCGSLRFLFHRCVPNLRRNVMNSAVQHV